MIIQQMKPLLTALLLPMLAFHVLGQSPASTNALTDEETAKILADITKVQREFVKTKKEVLAGALERFKAAAAGDAQALDLFLASYRVVNLDRKPAVTKEEQEARANGDWQKKALASAGESASPTVLRLQLQLLVLMLEAQAPDTAGKEADAIVKSLRGYMQGVIGILPSAAAAVDEPPERRNAPGPGKRARKDDDEDRAAEKERLRRKGGAVKGLKHDVMDTVFAAAYNLGAYFEPPAQWPRSPADFRAAYLNVILPWHRTNKKEELPGLWDEYLKAETTMQQIGLGPDALAAWGAKEYKDLYWAKWLDLLTHGVNAAAAAQELVKLVGENPSHPSLKTWIADLAKVAEKMGGLKFDDAAPGVK